MTRRPSGSPAPATVTLVSGKVVLAPLLEAVADRYFAEFPGDLERYGDAAREWELHDTAHCIQWAVLDVRGFASLERNIVWLANVLDARGFPLDQLARNLELAAEVAAEPLGERVAAALNAAAELVRSIGAA
jgi:hypothetical protein